MKKYLEIFFLLIFFCPLPTVFAQVDVVYNNLVWSDEFDNDGAVNSVKWHHQTQLPNGSSWYNGEVQHYTNLITNSFVSDGKLTIKAIKEPYTNEGVTKQYTSARLNSKFAFTYGRVDIRAKIPTSQGTWPALWLLGKNINEPGGFWQPQFGNLNWPACGEIDIMEHGITPSQPQNYIQSAIHTPSSFGSTINHGGTIASNLGNDFHVYSMNWSPFQITFLLDGVPFYTYNPAIKNANTWPFDSDQYLLLNIAMGGVAGNIPTSFTQASMEIDYVRVYQNTEPDNQPPTAFTATVGEITSSTIELLLNANDNSGTVVYSINYGSNSIMAAHASGEEKSVVISNLLPLTTYTFTVSAIDVTGNAYINNPIVLDATTTAVLGCSGSDIQAQQGSFTSGYNYHFETIGNDVKITFELLDTDKVGVVAFLWRQTPFSEYQMANVTGNQFTYTITNQTQGATINYAVKFAYAGGLSVTKYFSYIVGSNCALEVPNVEDNQTYFSIINPVKDFVQINTSKTIDRIELFDLMGRKLFQSYQNINMINVNDIPKGNYILIISAGGIREAKKIIIQ
jgi:beta-glucanase (GH16 family)